MGRTLDISSSTCYALHFMASKTEGDVFNLELHVIQISSHISQNGEVKVKKILSITIVHDAITTAGGVRAMPVTESMLSNAQGARQSEVHGLLGSTEKEAG